MLKLVFVRSSALEPKMQSQTQTFLRQNSQENNHAAYMSEYTQSDMSSAKNVRTNCGSGRLLMTHSVMKALCFTSVRKGGRTVHQPVGVFLSLCFLQVRLV